VLREALNGLQGLIPRTPGPTWIVCYHLMDAGTGHFFDIPRRSFIEQLDMYQSQTQVVTLQQVVRELRKGPENSETTTPAMSVGLQGDTAVDTRPASAAPDGAVTPNTSGGDIGQSRPRVVLTFDDACRNFYEVALPLLAERSFPATLYAPPGFVNGDGNHPFYEPRFSHLKAMSWSELREAAAYGIEIGSHTYRHTNLNRLNAKELIDEFHRARSQIEDHLGVTPRSVCYPEGFVVRRVVRAAARFHESGVLGGGRPLDMSKPATGEYLLQLPRLPVRAHVTAEQLAGFLSQPICLEECVSDNLRRLRGRLGAHN
jgi:hypothetical protein